MKIVTIGAGSSYTPELCDGLIKRYKFFPVTEWWLVDVEDGEEKLNIIYELVIRMFKKAKLPVKVFKTFDRREALIDADFVTTQLRVGRLEARAHDEYIPLKYEMIGQETNGIGGFFKALRTIPVILDIVKDVEELSKKDVWVINFTNPAGIVTEAVNRLTNFKRFIGVCNVPIHMKMDVCKIIDSAEKDVRYDCCGLNHLSYFTHFYKNNIDITSLILNEVKNPEVSKRLSMRNISSISWDPDLLDNLNAVPSPYMRYYYMTDEILAEYKELAKEKKIRATVVQEVEDKLFEKYKNINLSEKPVELEQRGGAYYSDVACGVMLSLYTDNGDEHTVNTINDGKISNLPTDWIVEATTSITKDGPIKLNRELSIPDYGLVLIETMKTFELGVIEAIRNKSLEQSFEALMTNPLVFDQEITLRCFKELVVAHAKHLKYFNDLYKFLETY